MLELPEEASPIVVLRRGALDQVRVSRVRYRETEWVTFRRWELDPGHGWQITNTVALHPDEVTAVMATLAFDATTTTRPSPQRGTRKTLR